MKVIGSSSVKDAHELMYMATVQTADCSGPGWRQEPLFLQQSSKQKMKGRGAMAGKVRRCNSTSFQQVDLVGFTMLGVREGGTESWVRM
jgi:hypothetical protein